MTMKVITGVALALATVMSSSAFAQTTRVNPWDAYQAYGQAEYAPQANQPRHSPHRSWDVYNTNGRYVGSDPGSERSRYDRKGSRRTKQWRVLSHPLRENPLASRVPRQYRGTFRSKAQSVRIGH